MDIESKRFRIRSDVVGFTITNKLTGCSVNAAKAPSAYELAMIHEREFDKAMEDLFRLGEQHVG